MTNTDLSNHVVLVTGGTDGIGRAAAVRLAERDATVVVTGRDERKAGQVREALTASAGDGEVLLADLADPGEVRGLARTVRDRYDRLDVLVNNAGTWQDRRRLADGWGDEVEYTVAVNHLAPFLLTNCLVPLLEASAPARVVTVSSELHRRGEIDLETFASRPDFDGQGTYADSKLANVLFTAELADRLAGTGVTANALHPGAIPATSLSRDTSGLSSVVWSLMRWLPFTDGIDDGAEAIEYVATAPELEDVTGEYFHQRERRRPASVVENRELRAALWEHSADLAGISPEVPDVDPLA